MISDAKDQVSPSAYLRSEPVPSTWVATFAWSRDWWINQENGWLADEPPSLPDWNDVGKMAGWRLR